MEEQQNPMDQLNVQLPGRLLVVEVLLTLLLRGLSRKRHILRDADGIIAHLETEVLKTTPQETTRYAMEVFTAARFNLDKLAQEALR